MFLLNGEPDGRLDIADRGFQYGDGLFETLEVVNGKPLFLEQHLARLQVGCKTLLIPAPNIQLLTAEALQCAASAAHAVLKLILSRGSGGRGYRLPAEVSPTRLFTLHPYPDYPAEFQYQGVVLCFCQHRLPENPLLAGIKHLNRLDQILARAEWREDGIQEGLMLDNRGFVIEGTMSNLFLVSKGILYTPDISRCGVAGIARELVMELARQQGIPVQIADMNMLAVIEADELFICNSVLGIWPVRQLELQHWQPGPITGTLQKLYEARREAEF
jgi:4-amino-4-deoxychorismate lyase